MKLTAAALNRSENTTIKVLNNLFEATLDCASLKMENLVHLNQFHMIYFGHYFHCFSMIQPLELLLIWLSHVMGSAVFSNTRLSTIFFCNGGY